MFLRLQHADYGQTVKNLNNILKTVICSFNIPKHTKLTVIIDITDYPYYGDRISDLCVGSKAKAGTLYFNRFFTACIHLGKFYIPLYIHPILQTESVSPGNLIKAFLKEIYHWCPVSRLLVDAYFCAGPVLKNLKQYHLEFLLNMKRYSNVKRVVHTLKEAQHLLAASRGINASDTRKMHQWLKKRKLLTFKTTIHFDNNPKQQIPLVVYTVILKRKKKDGKRYFKLDYYVYMINITTSGEHLLKIYKMRWEIETEYHIVHMFQGKTTSHLTVIRVLLKGLGFILTALWIRLNVILKRENFTKRAITDRLMSVESYKRIFSIYTQLQIPDLNILEIHANDTLILTVWKLCRILQSLWR